MVLRQKQPSEQLRLSDSLNGKPSTFYFGDEVSDKRTQTTIDHNIKI